MPTELTWDGKYNPDGSKKAPLRVELPFQTVETINESAQDRQKMFDLFGSGEPTDWRNRLIWGDKKYVLPSLLPEFAGKVDLIYIDPPFFTGDNFSFNVQVGTEEFTKEPSIMERRAYNDTWGNGLDSYLPWFYETMLSLYDLLSEKGSIYVHLDWHVGHYAKVIMDEIFGYDNFRNEIVWHYSGWRRSDNYQFSRKHDTLFFYSKSVDTWEYKVVAESWVPGWSLDELRKLIILNDSNGDYFNSEKGKVYLTDLLAEYLANRKQSIKSDDIGQFIWADGRNTVKRYLKDVLVEGKAIDDVWNIRALTTSAIERLAYDTQKPEVLLERIIKASSNEGDLVLDCFCGSGTTAAVAEKLGRRWITCDLGRFAIHTARKRLLSIPNVKPFVIQNLGKYERQLWQSEEFGPNAEQRLAEYTRFIVDLFQAQPLTGYAWLHGIKGGRVIHIGSVDSPVTISDLQSIIREWRSTLKKTGAANNGIDILGWEFAFEMNETARQQAQESGVDLRFYTIPREVLEKKAVEQGDIQFFELAALFTSHQLKGRQLTVQITNFIPPLEYVPQEVREKITQWQSWIDYWAVDFNFRDDTFHNEWQSYRTRKDRSLTTEVSHIYDQPGTYQVQIKVIDILGNDTTRTIEVVVV